MLTAPVEAAAAHPPAAAPDVSPLDVVISAALYVAYNVAVVPAVLFCLHRQTRRTETFSSGILAGVAMTVPFALTLACLLRFPQSSVMDAEVPWLPMITTAADGRAGGPALWIAIFGLVAGWTLIETAVGSIHALLRRVESNLDDLPRRWRPASGRLTRGQKAVTAVGVLVAAAGLATFGIIDLVARGYGTLAWGFIALVVVPLFVVVPWRSMRAVGQLWLAKARPLADGLTSWPLDLAAVLVCHEAPKRQRSEDVPFPAPARGSRWRGHHDHALGPACRQARLGGRRASGLRN